MTQSLPTDQAAQATTHTTPVAETSGRLVSLDVFRGLTVIVMLLVNFPGTSVYYAPLSHTEWNGCRPADLVFPFFLFIVGVSLSFGLAGARHDPARRPRVWRSILRRTVLLIVMGLLIDLIPKFYFTSFRIPGVLQRIGLVFLVCSGLFLRTSWRTQLLIFAVLLIGYNVLLALVPVPGIGPANLGHTTNLVAWLDRQLFTYRHLYDELLGFDPEGLLSTLPAIGTGLLGMWAGQWLRQRQHDAATRVAWLMVASILSVVLSLIWNSWFPINKQLWTSSFVLYTGGIGGLMLAVLYWLCDVQQWRRGLWVPLVFGSNAIVVYFLSEVGDKLLGAYDVTLADGTSGPVRTWVFETWFLPLSTNLPLTALLYALAYTAVWGVLAGLLYWRRIFIKL